MLEALPTKEGDAIPLKEIVEVAKAPRSTAVQVLDEGVAAGTIAKGGSGKRGDPFVYWRPGEMVSAGASVVPAETNGTVASPATELLSAGTHTLRPAESNSGDGDQPWFGEADRLEDLAYDDEREDELPW